MKNFIDQAGPLWMKDRLVGNVGSVSTATQHGGQEATILSLHVVLLDLGLTAGFEARYSISKGHGRLGGGNARSSAARILLRQLDIDRSAAFPCASAWEQLNHWR